MNPDISTTNPSTNLRGNGLIFKKDFRIISLLRKSQRNQWPLSAVSAVSGDSPPKVTGDTDGQVRDVECACGSWEHG